MSHYFLLSSKQTRVITPTAASGLCHLNICNVTYVVLVHLHQPLSASMESDDSQGTFAFQKSLHPHEGREPNQREPLAGSTPLGPEPLAGLLGADSERGHCKKNAFEFLFKIQWEVTLLHNTSEEINIIFKMTHAMNKDVPFGKCDSPPHCHISFLHPFPRFTV